MSEPKVKCNQGGPNLVFGVKTVEKADGTTVTVDKEPMALCACGNSANKPFCDGAHQKKD